MRRSLLVVLALIVALPAAGALYQTLAVRRGAVRFLPPGRLVDVGGRRLHLVCIGSGQPAVIFESSVFSSSVSFAAARTEISTHTRVCSYDRMGMAWSDPGSAIISFGALADDLERLLDRAGEAPPYILAPSSMGGLVVELFARRHPERVAGLVFIDAGHSAVLERFASRVTSRMTTAACLLPVAARLGLIRLFDPLKLGRDPRDADAIFRLYRAEPMGVICALVTGLSASLQEFREAPPLASDVPLTVLTAETTEGLFPPGLASDGEVVAREWRDLQQQLSRRSSRGTWRVVPGSTHLIAGSQPHAVAIAALDLLGQARHTPR